MRAVPLEKGLRTDEKARGGSTRFLPYFSDLPLTSRYHAFPQLRLRMPSINRVPEHNKRPGESLISSRFPDLLGSRCERAMKKIFSAISDKMLYFFKRAFVLIKNPKLILCTCF